MRFIWGKFLHLVIVVVTVTALTFVMLNLMPVSIAHVIAGHNATMKDVAAIEAQLGLNDPVTVRYGKWLAGVMTGNLGKSLVTGQPVRAALASHLPVTLELLILTQMFALVIALPIGIISAWRAGSKFDRFFATVGFGLTSIPPFALAIVLVFFFSLRLKWLPAIGYTPISGGAWANLRGFLIPAFSIALVEWVILMRVLRSDIIATLKEDFILLARAKGLPEWKVMLRHALRPSCLSTITIFGLQIGNLIGGAVIIENLFALPGIGRLLLSSIFAQDFPVVQGCVLLISAGYVGVNLVVDASYRLLDPRIRKESALG